MNCPRRGTHFRIAENHRIHAERMGELERDGLDHEAASEQAYDEFQDGRLEGRRRPKTVKGR